MTAMLGACASSVAGVDVRSVQTEIVFGAKTVSQDVTPPAFNAPTVRRPITTTFFEPPGSFPPLPRTEPRACPEAGLTDFPETEATDRVGERPPIGRYVWKRSGEVRLAGSPFPFELTGFESRLVRNVEDSLTVDFTFQTVQSDELYSDDGVTREFVITSWQVRSENVAQSLPLPFGPGIRPADPEAGVALTKIERFTLDGELIGSFEPNPVVIYLPLPVLIGETFASQGTDPTTLDTLQHQGRVIGRRRVDACGDVVDSWAIEGTQTFTGISTSTRTYHYNVATQLGGLIVRERAQFTQGAAQVDSVYELGQLEPDPLNDEDLE